MEALKNGVESIRTGLDVMKTSLDTIATFCDYMIHPIKILIALWELTVKISAPVCLTGALACIILYAMGYKKFGKGITLSFVIYIVIQAINAAMRVK